MLSLDPGWHLAAYLLAARALSARRQMGSPSGPVHAEMKSVRSFWQQIILYTCDQAYDYIFPCSTVRSELTKIRNAPEIGPTMVLRL